jgi:REP element-mobilizing transposase RayT
MGTASMWKSGSKRKRRVRVPKGILPFKQHGGARPGAGRKPRGEKAGVSHRTRAKLAGRFPVHVTVSLVRGLPGLRHGREYAVLRGAFAAGCDRFGFRLVHYAVLHDHLHLLVEAADRKSLSRGLQGLLIRVAKALNKLWARGGSVFADRYHDRILESPREVRTCLVYVLANGHKHHRQGRGPRPTAPLDVFTSAPWFDGWRERVVIRGLEALAPPVTSARTWLLAQGWRRHGLLSVLEAPAA